MTDPQHPAVRFRATIESVAASQLADAAETPEGRQTLARFGAAFAAAARQARDPSAFYNADPASIASAAVLSLQTGLTPGGPMPEVFLVPRGRELQWSVTHRGLMRLARKAGWTVRAVVVHVRDLPSVELVDGQVRITAQDPANYVQRLGDIGGVAIFASSASIDVEPVSVWTPGDKIRIVAKKGGPVWKTWPAEMAAKTAIKDAFSRGAIPIESEAIGAAIATEPEYESRPSPVVVNAPGLTFDDEAPEVEPPEDTTDLDAI
jgi:recombinational DNA repair protein RecT